MESVKASTPAATAPSLKRRFFNGSAAMFSAAYAIMLLAVAIVLSTLTWLSFLLCAIAANAMDGHAGVIDARAVSLWGLALLIVTLPLGAYLFHETKRLLANRYDNALPTNGLKGLQTFLTVVAGLGAMVSAAGAIFAPLLAATEDSSKIGLIAVSMTLPLLVSAILSLAFIFLVSRTASDRRVTKAMFWVTTALAFALIGGAYLWGGKGSSPDYTSPATNEFLQNDSSSQDSSY